MKNSDKRKKIESQGFKLVLSSSSANEIYIAKKGFVVIKGSIAEIYNKIFTNLTQN